MPKGLYVGKHFTYRGTCGITRYDLINKKVPSVPPLNGTALVVRELGTKRVEVLIGEDLYKISKYYLLEEIERDIKDSPKGILIRSLEQIQSALKNLDMGAATQTTTLSGGEEERKYNLNLSSLNNLNKIKLARNKLFKTQELISSIINKIEEEEEKN